MKYFVSRLIAVLLLFSLVLPCSALTFEELAGTYVGHRTETWPDGVHRYDEIDVFTADGFVYNYLYQDGVLIYTSSAQLRSSEDGTVWESDQFSIELHGNHLEVIANFGEIQVHVKTHRTNKSVL